MDELKRVSKIKQELKMQDDFELRLDDAYFDRLHDKIMKKVDETVMVPAPVLLTPRNLLRSHWRGWLYPSGGILSLFLLTSVLMTQVSKVNHSLERVGLFSDGHERIVQEALLSPEDLSQTLISTQSESDFFIDLAAESFENLSVAKFKQVMGESTR